MSVARWLRKTGGAVRKTLNSFFPFSFVLLLTFVGSKATNYSNVETPGGGGRGVRTAQGAGACDIPGCL